MSLVANYGTDSESDSNADEQERADAVSVNNNAYFISNETSFVNLHASELTILKPKIVLCADVFG